MIDIRDATLCWKSDEVWVEPGDTGPQPDVSCQPIDGLQSAMAAAWSCATDGYEVAEIHRALLQLDRYADVFAGP